MPEFKTTRCDWKHKGQSVYRVEQLEPPPTFSKGDGRDNGRNLLGALLIGPSWRHVGYVVGSRGAWSPYLGWKIGGLCQYPACETVAVAADRLMLTAEREQVS